MDNVLEEDQIGDGLGFYTPEKENGEEAINAKINQVRDLLSQKKSEMSSEQLSKALAIVKEIRAGNLDDRTKIERLDEVIQKFHSAENTAVEEKPMEHPKQKTEPSFEIPTTFTPQKEVVDSVITERQRQFEERVSTQKAELQKALAKLTDREARFSDAIRQIADGKKMIADGEAALEELTKE